MSAADVRKKALTGRVIADGWLEMKRAVFADVAPEEAEDFRKTFFGGAAFMFQTLVTMMDMEAGVEATDADLRRIDMLHAEITAFAEEQLQRIADRGMPPGAPPRAH